MYGRTFIYCGLIVLCNQMVEEKELSLSVVSEVEQVITF